MKDKRCIGKIIDYKRLNNSYYGNPRYEVLIQLPDCVMNAKTKLNASIAYSILNNLNGVNEFTYHTTPIGNNIITRMDIISR